MLAMKKEKRKKKKKKPVFGQIYLTFLPFYANVKLGKIYFTASILLPRPLPYF